MDLHFGPPHIEVILGFISPENSDGGNCQLVGETHCCRLSRALAFEVILRGWTVVAVVERGEVFCGFIIFFFFFFFFLLTTKVDFLVVRILLVLYTAKVVIWLYGGFYFVVI